MYFKYIRMQKYIKIKKYVIYNIQYLKIYNIKYIYIKYTYW